MNNKKMIEVVAAVIVKDNMILATQRGYGEFKGKWEFPGGKVEFNENLKNALIREIKEETNADINVIEYINTVEYEYSNFFLKMHSYLCELSKNNLEFVYHDNNSLEHENMVWLDLEDLEKLDWLPADILVIDELKKQNKLKDKKLLEFFLTNIRFSDSIFLRDENENKII